MAKKNTKEAEIAPRDERIDERVDDAYVICPVSLGFAVLGLLDSHTDQLSKPFLDSDSELSEAVATSSRSPGSR